MEKVYYKHTTIETKKKNGIQNHNRVTFAGVVINNELRISYAKCSIKDQFVKEKGRVIALGRAKSKHPVYSESILPEDNVGKRFVEIVKSNLIPIN